MPLNLIIHRGPKQGQIITIEKFPAVFGRGGECNYQLAETGISRRHFTIEYTNNEFIIQDLQSKNGTYLNDKLLVSKKKLQNHDIILIPGGIAFQAILEKPADASPSLTPEKDEECNKAAEFIPMVRRRIDLSETSIFGPSQEKLYYSYRALKIIYEVMQSCNDESNHELLFESMLRSLFKAIPADRAAVVLKRQNTYHGKSFVVKGGKSEAFLISQTILKDVIENGVSVISYNTERDLRYRDSESLRFQRVGSLICTPLISYKRVLGAVYLDRNQPESKPFGEEELELMAAIGIQVGSSLEKSLLLAELEISLKEKERLVSALVESEERYALAARGANDGLWDWDLKSAKIYFSPRWKDMLGYLEEDIDDTPAAWFEHIHPEDRKKVEIEIEAHLKGLTNHFENEHRMLHHDGTYRWMLTRGLAVHDRENNIFRMAGSQTDITERKVAEQQLLHDAFHDALTNLPNRALFMDRLNNSILRAKRADKYHYGVIFLGLDRFKIINDSLGHKIGDCLLIAIARRLEKCIRDGDTLARFAGDAFIILFDGVKDIRDLTLTAEYIQQQLGLLFNIENYEIFTSASMGIVMGTNEDERGEDILRNADTAMYRAKELGRACYQVFDRAMYERSSSLLQLETDLRRAIERQEFHIYYQPIVFLESGRIAGFEALVRWEHPQRGLILPGEFIPIAEETGLILPIGSWILHGACQQICKWQRQFPMEPPLFISVNLSTKQILSDNIVQKVEQIIGETGINPQNLKLEITETVIMENSELIKSVLNSLKALHLHLQMDDFGTGYSSLSYLHNFPIDSLKIDRSFIACMEDKENLEIVRTILTLGRNLSMKIVAEGIDSGEKFSYLQALKCDYGQGYFISKPIDCTTTTTWIADHVKL